MINVASARNGVGYGPWTHIDGFSEAVIDYIRELETNSPQLKTKTAESIKLSAVPLTRGNN